VKKRWFILLILLFWGHLSAGPVLAQSGDDLIPSLERDAVHKDYQARRQEYKNFYAALFNNDGKIDKIEKIFLDLKRVELGLSEEEVESIEFMVRLESPILINKD